ncbi:MAG: oligosaccharide flippase family protein [Sediminibacterium sp.]|nr:oligosaccharide flippase family protein [Sediminibacterium sp.]
MLFKKILSDSLIYTIGPQLPKIASIFILPIITPYLTSNDYGIAGIILAYTTLLGALSDLGFSVLMMNSFYNYKLKWRHYWGQYHFYLSIWSIIYSILMGGLLFFIMPVEAEKNKLLIISFFVVPALFFNVTTIIATRYYQYSSKPFYISSVSAFVGVLAVILNLVTIVYYKMGYLGWFFSNFVASLITFLFYLYPVYFKYKIWPIFRFRKAFLKKSLMISLPLLPHNYSAFLLNTSDRVVMERMHVPTGEIGKYNLAYTFGGYLEFFGNAIGMAIGPIYTSMFSNKSIESARSIKFLTNFLQVCFLFISVIISVWCKEIFSVLIQNKSLNQVYPIAIIIIMGYAYRPYYWTAITRLQYSEQTKDLWKITFVAGILNVILNIIFIPIYGIVAAALTTYCCLMYMGFAGYFLKSFKKVETEKYNPLTFILLIIIATVLTFLIKDLRVLYKSIITLFLCLLFFFFVSKNKKKLFEIKFS